MTTTDRYRDRVMSCWLGKAIGGTLGMPFEGRDGPFDFDFYEPVPTGMVSNDDLDLQVLWACKLAEMPRPRVDRDWMADAWLHNVQFPWDEYGVAIRNLKLGLRPPQSGSFDNWFACGMGAAIRTEIWACLAPGDPAMAARFAYEDACVDHAGDGVWAAVFLAGLEAAAFVENAPATLIDLALQPLPAHSRVRQCVIDTQAWLGQGGDWRGVRSQILERYGHENFTDVVMNIGFTILGWLAGGNDFGRSICIANNCGKDTDCTAATVGALLGILNPDRIPDRWLAPIGRSLVVDRRITGISPPDTLDGFTDLVVDIANRLDRSVVSERVEQHDQPLPFVSATIAFVPAAAVATDEAPALPANAKPVRLPGFVSELSRDDFADDAVLVRYTIKLEKPQCVRFVANSHEQTRVWIDGRFAFARSGGDMCPALHRAPGCQWTDVDLAAGEHELLVAIHRSTGPTTSWAVAIGDAKTHQWLPSLFQTEQRAEPSVRAGA